MKTQILKTWLVMFVVLLMMGGLTRADPAGMEEVFFDDFDDGDYNGWSATHPSSGDPTTPPDVVSSPEGYSLRGVGSGYSQDPGLNVWLTYPLLISNAGELKIEMRAKSGSQWPNSAWVYLISGADHYAFGDYGESNQYAEFFIRIDGVSEWYNYSINANVWHDFAWTRDADGWWSLSMDGRVEAPNFHQDNQLTSFEPIGIQVLRNQSEIEWVRISTTSAVHAGAILSPWQPQSDMPVANHGFGDAVVGGLIYAIGGTGPDPGWGTNRVQRYNPATDTWVQVASMPTARHTLRCAVVDGYIYAIGGHVTNSRSENERYDPSTNTWQSMASKPTAVSGPGVAAFGGKIYTFGGNRYGSMQSVIEMYDPQTNKWQSVGNMPAAGEPWRVATLGDKIYLAGGYFPSEGGITDHLWAYDPLSGTWETDLPKLNIKRGGHELVAVGDYLFAIGGSIANGPLNSVEWWTPGASGWTLDESLNIARSHLGAEAVGDTLYVFGGYDGENLSSTESAVVVLEPTCEWVLLDGRLNIPRHGLTGEAVNGYLYAIGGIAPPYNVSDAQNAVSKYNPATDTWTLVASMPTARHSPSSAVIGNHIYAVGGHVANSRSACERYNVLTDTWESMASKPTAVSGPGVAAFGGKIYVFGGNSYGSKQSVIEVYDPGTNAWSSAGNMPAAGIPWRAVTLGDRIYIGTHIVSTNDEIWCYDPVNKIWDTGLLRLNEPRSCCELAVANGRIYAIGGSIGDNLSVESWAPGEDSWRMEPSLNIGRSQFGSAVIGNDIYVFGATDGSDYPGATEVLTICEAPPGTHDECAYAIPVQSNEPYNGSTTGATGTDTSSCSYNDTNDVWHSFTPGFSYDYTISLCGSAFDTTLAVFDECGGTELVCNDDTAPGVCPNKVQSQLTVPLLKGTTYFIRIAGYNGETGDYTLTITGPKCLGEIPGDVNNDCKVDFLDFAIMASHWLECNLDAQEACWQ